MGWIIFTVLMALVIIAVHLLGGWVRGKVPTEDQERVLDERRRAGYGGNEDLTRDQKIMAARFIGFGVPAAVFIFWAIVTGTSMVTSIQKGHVGLVHTFGKITETRANGLSVIAPWQTMEVVDVRSKTICAKGDTPKDGQCGSTFEPFSKENIDVHLHGVFTYHVDPADIAFLYTKIGASFEDRIILPMLSDVVRFEVNKFGYQEIAANRPVIGKNIFDAMNTRLANHPQPGVSAIKADAFAMMNFDFNPDVKQGINEKVLESERANAAQARQNTQRLDALAREEKAKGDAKVAEAIATGEMNAAITRANGQAQATTIQAEATAHANAIINNSLTPNILALRISEGQKVQWATIAPGTSIVGMLSDMFKGGAPVVPVPVPPAPAPPPAPAGQPAAR